MDEQQPRPRPRAHHRPGLTVGSRACSGHGQSFFGDSADPSNGCNECYTTKCYGFNRPPRGPDTTALRSTIVGIVADVKQTGLDEARSEAVYVAHGMVPTQANFAFAVRTTPEPATVAPDVRRVFRNLDPRVPLVRLQTMDAIVARATAPARSSAVLLARGCGGRELRPCAARHACRSRSGPASRVSGGTCSRLRTRTLEA